MKGKKRVVVVVLGEICCEQMVCCFQKCDLKLLLFVCFLNVVLQDDRSLISLSLAARSEGIRSMIPHTRNFIFLAVKRR